MQKYIIGLQRYKEFLEYANKSLECAVNICFFGQNRYIIYEIMVIWSDICWHIKKPNTINQGRSPARKDIYLLRILINAKQRIGGNAAIGGRRRPNSGINTQARPVRGALVSNFVGVLLGLVT
ncbi:MAG: hypothetical protein MJZ75_07340 [Paludibacteraceae bacterium]|nr:hypothetical protein [Paludibacteraceae bacterium]